MGYIWNTFIDLHTYYVCKSMEVSGKSVLHKITLTTGFAGFNFTYA